MRSERFDERGVTVVEAAFVLPLLFFLVLTMIDLGMWGFQTSQATSAARDGARVGIIDYVTAKGPVPGGADYTAIEDAAKARLGGSLPNAFTVTVKCVVPDGTTELTNGCASAKPGCDRVMVTVSWSRAALSPFIGRLFGASTVNGESIMVIAGAPTTPSGTTTTTSAAPNGCAAL